LLDYRGPEGQEAKSILREIRSVASTGAGAGAGVGVRSPLTAAGATPGQQQRSSSGSGLREESDMMMSHSGASLDHQDIYLLDDSDEDRGA
jgi:hypothetical protein